MIKKAISLCLLSILVAGPALSQGVVSKAATELCIKKCADAQTKCTERNSGKSSAMGFLMGKICETAYTKCENACTGIKPKEEKDPEEEY